MTTSPRWLALPFLLSVSCAYSVPKVTFSLPDLQTRLKNGIRVILLPDASTDLVEIDVRYEVGSREDPEGKAGLAHLVEHLMFQQRQAGPDKPNIGAVMNKSAVYVNAFTNWDSTHYVTLAPASALDALVALEAARLHTGCETIDEDTFKREREVVRNEIRLRMGSPQAQAARRVVEALYPKPHPYHEFIGGDDKQLAAITLPDVCKFMADYYVPERAIFVIAGKVNEKDGARLAGQFLDPLVAKAGAPRKQVTPISASGKTLEIELPVEEPMVMAAWPLPPTYTKEGRLAREGLGRIFGHAADLGLTYEFATEFGAGVLGGDEAPLFYMSISVSGESKIDDAKSALRKAGEWGQRKTFMDSKETLKFRSYLMSQVVAELEALPARSIRFADYAQFAPQGGYLGGELAEIRSLTGGQANDVVKRVLGADKATYVIVRPKKTEKAAYERAKLEYAATGTALTERDQLPIDRTEAARELTVPEHVTKLANARSFTLDNGLKVLLLPLEGALPVFTVALEFKVGNAHEAEGKEGLADLAANQIRPPAPDKMTDSAFEEAEVDVYGELGIQWGRRVGADSTTFFARGMSIYADVAVVGLERWVKAGEYSQQSIESNQRMNDHAAKRKSASSRERFEVALAQLMFPSHPYGRIETFASFKRLGRDQAMAWQQDHYSAKNATLVVVGTFDGPKVEAAIRDSYGIWSAGRSDSSPAATSLNRPGAVFFGVEGESLPTIDISIAYPMPAGIDEKQAARLVIAEMLNERLKVVREKLGVSYGVYARQLYRIGPGALYMSGPADAARAGEALKAMREVIPSLRGGDHFIEDFVRARRAVLHSLVVEATDSYGLAQRLLVLSRHGLPLTFGNDLVQRVAKLTPRDVMTVLGEIKPEAEVVGLLGPKKDVEKAFADAGIKDFVWK